jgi:hypothetical protein
MTPELKPLSSDDWVAYCAYQHHDEGIVTIDTCDSDAKGAFKVYRHPLWPQIPSDEEIETWLNEELSDCVCSYCESDRSRVRKFVEWIRSQCPAVSRPIEDKLRGELETMKEARANRPKIVCFCGSSRFIAEMAVLMWEWEKAGHIAIGLHLMPSGYGEARGFGKEYHHLGELEGVAEQMDELHKRKIDLADEIFVVNVDGYIGKSTRSAIEYAIAHNKPVKYLVADSIAQREGEG